MKQINPNTYLEFVYNNIFLFSINSKFYHKLFLYNDFDNRYLERKALKKTNRIFFDLIKYISSSNYLILWAK
jgi:hypothetical protein